MSMSSVLWQYRSKIYESLDASSRRNRVMRAFPRRKFKTYGARAGDNGTMWAWSSSLDVGRPWWERPWYVESLKFKTPCWRVFTYEKKAWSIECMAYMYMLCLRAPAPTWWHRENIARNVGAWRHQNAWWVALDRITELCCVSRSWRQMEVAKACWIAWKILLGVWVALNGGTKYVVPPRVSVRHDDTKMLVETMVPLAESFHGVNTFARSG